MAAARQKEMKVSITEDATINRTRLEGGATVVREDPIAKCRVKFRPFDHPEGPKKDRTPCDEFICEKPESQQKWNWGPNLLVNRFSPRQKAL
jgi:hypothetical protein